MGITIRQVARQAGVSVATVSRVFNNSGPVGEETRAQVLRVARQLRFVPNSMARSLSMNRTQTLGVLLPDLHGEFFSELLRGVDREARQQQFHLLVSSAHSDRREAEAALRTMNGRVDGLLVMTPDLEPTTLEANLPPNLPVVLLNARMEANEYDTFAIDNEGGARAMTQHLLGLGHRRITMIAGAAGNRDAIERQRGFVATMQEAGAEADVVAGDFMEESGARAARLLLQAEALPSAIFAANDSMAVGVLSVLREAGVDVPAHVAVVGFDDIPVARYLSPALTSVQVPIYDLGQQAAHRLLHTVGSGNGATPVHETLPTRLVVRQSCGNGLPARPAA